MNDLSPIMSERQINDLEMQQKLFSLSQTQRRLSHEYKRWALEAESDGKLGAYQKYRMEADRLWREAKWHLRRAQEVSSC